MKRLGRHTSFTHMHERIMTGRSPFTDYKSPQGVGVRCKYPSGLIRNTYSTLLSTKYVQ